MQCGWRKDSGWQVGLEEIHTEQYTGGSAVEQHGGIGGGEGGEHIEVLVKGENMSVYP